VRAYILGHLLLLALAGCSRSQVIPVPGRSGPQLYEARATYDSKALEVATKFCAAKGTGVEIEPTLCIGPSPFYFRCIGPVGRNPNEIYIDPEVRVNARKFCVKTDDIGEAQSKFCKSLESP
jgi:hypothetical protein